jgi:hypothetical protein
MVPTNMLQKWLGNQGVDLSYPRHHNTGPDIGTLERRQLPHLSIDKAEWAKLIAFFIIHPSVQ